MIHDQTFLQRPFEWSGDNLIRREKMGKKKKKKRRRVKHVVTCTPGSLGELFGTKCIIPFFFSFLNIGFLLVK